MDDSNRFCCLYDAVLDKQRQRFDIFDKDLKEAMIHMGKYYLKGALDTDNAKIPNYRDAGYRCGYLHKFAPCHTCLLVKVLKENPIFDEVHLEIPGCFKICSLGGGPGTDVIATLTAMSEINKTFQISVSIIDYMLNWNQTFRAILEEIRSGEYESLGEMFATECFEYTYFQADLFSEFTDDTNFTISNADFVTMIKFISPAPSQVTEETLQRILYQIKPGAVVLFIDNAGGGYHELMKKVAEIYRFIPVIKPMRMHYKNENLEAWRLCIPRCYDIKVTVQVWKKRKSPHLHTPLRMTKLPKKVKRRKRRKAISSGTQKAMPFSYTKATKNESHLVKSVQKKLQKSQLNRQISRTMNLSEFHFPRLPSGTEREFQSERPQNQKKPPMYEVSPSMSKKNFFYHQSCTPWNQSASAVQDDSCKENLQWELLLSQRLVTNTDEIENNVFAASLKVEKAPKCTLQYSQVDQPWFWPSANETLYGFENSMNFPFQKNVPHPLIEEVSSEDENMLPFSGSRLATSAIRSSEEPKRGLKMNIISTIRQIIVSNAPSIVVSLIFCFWQELCLPPPHLSRDDSLLTIYNGFFLLKGSRLRLF